MLQLKLMLNTRLCPSQVLFVGLQVPLVRILQRCGQGGHDLATVTKISANFRPFLGLANRLKSAPDFHSFFQLVEVKRPLVHAGQSAIISPMLFVEHRKPVDVVHVGAVP